MSDLGILNQYKKLQSRAKKLGYTIREYDEYDVVNRCRDQGFLICKKKYSKNAEKLLHDSYENNIQDKWQCDHPGKLF